MPSPSSIPSSLQRPGITTSCWRCGRPASPTSPRGSVAVVTVAHTDGNVPEKVASGSFSVRSIVGVAKAASKPVSTLTEVIAVTSAPLAVEQLAAGALGGDVDVDRRLDGTTRDRQREGLLATERRRVEGAAGARLQREVGIDGDVVGDQAVAQVDGGRHRTERRARGGRRSPIRHIGNPYSTVEPSTFSS